MAPQNTSVSPLQDDDPLVFKSPGAQEQVAAPCPHRQTQRDTQKIHRTQGGRVNTENIGKQHSFTGDYDNFS